MQHECRMIVNCWLDWPHFVDEYMADVRADFKTYTAPTDALRPWLTKYADDCDREFLRSLNASDDQVQRAVGLKRYDFQVHVEIVGGYRDTKFARVGDLVYQPDWPTENRTVRVPISNPPLVTACVHPPRNEHPYDIEEYENRSIRWVDDVLTDFWQRVS